MSPLTKSLAQVCRVIAWPGVIWLFMSIWHGSRVAGRSELHAMAVAYPACLALLLVLERALPFRARYNDASLDARVDAAPPFHDLVHTAATAVAVEGTKALCEALFRQRLGVQAWGPLGVHVNIAGPALRAPVLALQVGAALVVAELGQYWQHRLSHTSAVLWPFHAVHHSVPRLHALNTGRFHAANQALATAMGFPLLYLAGFSDGAIYEYTGLYTVLGLLSHCNVDMRTGPLSLIFNTPECHRWHHSARLNESNANYGENIMLFDHAFGTYYRGASGDGSAGGDGDDGSVAADAAGDEVGGVAAPSAMGRARYADSAAAMPALLLRPRLVALPKSIMGQVVVPFTRNPLREAWGTLERVASLLAASPGPTDPYDSAYRRQAVSKNVCKRA